MNNRVVGKLLTQVVNTLSGQKTTERDIVRIQNKNTTSNDAHQTAKTKPTQAHFQMQEGKPEDPGRTNRSKLGLETKCTKNWKLSYETFF